MRITGRSPLSRVAFVVGDALIRHEVDAVLTAGACASIHSQGRYASLDHDFVIRRASTDRQALRAAVDIARASRVDLRRIRNWAREEDAEERLEDFPKAIAAAPRR